MLEVMGIRTGVQEEDESSSEEEERAWIRSGRMGPVGGRWSQSPITQFRHARRWSRSTPFPPSNIHEPPQTIVASHGRSSSINASSVFDAGSSDSEGNEVLPMSRSAGYYNHHHQNANQDVSASQSFPPDSRRSGSAGNGRGILPSSSTTSLRQAGEAWFHAIDERYLLPLFSNAVASRTHNAKKASRRATVPQAPQAGGTSPYEESEFESIPGSPVEPNVNRTLAPGGSGRGGAESPVGSLFDEGVRGAVKRKNQEVFKSIGSFWRGPGRNEERRDGQDDGSSRGGGSVLPGPGTQGS